MNESSTTHEDVEYGRTVADCLGFLGDADKVLIFVRIASDGEPQCLSIPPDVVISALATKPVDGPFPCEFWRGESLLAIGTQSAIKKAEQP